MLLFWAILWAGCLRSPNRALLGAAKTGDSEAAREALRKGADVHARDQEIGATALCFASAYGHPAVIRLLVRAGSDVNAQRQCGKMWVMGDLITEDPVIIYAAARGKSAAIQELIDAGANVNFPGTLGTPLMLAAHSGDLASVRLLLKAGANPSYKDASRDAADAWARSAGHPAIADLLRHAAKN
jgi:ankyrin repeat protein